MSITYSRERVAAMTPEERAAVVKQQLGVVSALRKQLPRFRRELDAMTLEEVVVNQHRWLHEADGRSGRLVDCYATLVILLQVDAPTRDNRQRTMTELVELARQEVARVKLVGELQAEGAPLEWAEQWALKRAGLDVDLDDQLREPPC